MLSVWFQLHLIRPLQPVLRSKCTRPTAAVLTLLLLMPVVALAQGGSPFDSGFTAIQSLFTGTIAKVASLVAIMISGYSSRTANQAQRKRSPELPPERASPYSPSMS